MGGIVLTARRGQFHDSISWQNGTWCVYVQSVCLIILRQVGLIAQFGFFAPTAIN